MMDEIQIATSVTSGKVPMAKKYFGKLVCVCYHPEKAAVRYSLRHVFIDAMDGFEFCA